MSNITSIDPMKPHVTIAIAAPEPRFSKGVRVVGGGYGGDTDDRIREYFRNLCGVGPDVVEAGGWRIVDLPYDHGEWMPDDPEPARPDDGNEEPFLRDSRKIFDGVLKEDGQSIG